MRVELNGSSKFRNGSHQFVKESQLDGGHFLLRAENFSFVLFEFFRDVALGLRERLLADPIVRNFILVRVAHFEVISEDVIE